MKVTAALSLIELPQIDTGPPTHSHEFSSECLDDVEMEETSRNTLREALASTETSIDLERKARLAQMIMQCSSNDFPRINDWKLSVAENTNLAAQNSVRTIPMVMEEISRSKEAFSAPTLHQRRLLIELAVMYEIQVRKEVEHMQTARKLRRRAQANGEKVEPLSNSGKTAQNRVLDRLIWQSASGDRISYKNQQLGSKERFRLRERINIGQNLCAIVLRLGPGALFGLPATTVYPSEISLSFGKCCHISLCQAIEPRE